MRNHVFPGDDAGKLLLRLTVGTLMLLHGLGKITSGPDSIVGMVENVGLPGQFGYLVYVGEVIAPLLMIFGVWTRLAALVVALNMVVAVALVHMGELFALGRSGGWALLGPGRYAIIPR